MSLFLGSIYSTVELDTGKLGGQARTAKNILGGVDRDIRGLGDNSERSFGRMVKASALGNIAAIGFSKGIEKVTGAARDSFGALMELQNSRASFEVLTGSASKATKVMADLAKYSNTTPFEFPEVARAGKTLLGFGIEAKNVGKIVRQLGDITGATGGDFYSIARVFGQVSAAGKLTAEDFNQLIDNGVALGDVIAKELNIPMKDLRKAMEEGKITTEVFQKAVEKATAANGKFYGGADKLSQTLSGRLSTLSDTFTGLVGKIAGVDFGTGVVKADGLFAKFSDTVVKLTDYFGSKGVQGAVQKATDELMGFGAFIGNIAATMSGQLMPPLKGFVDALLGPLKTGITAIITSPFAQFMGTILTGAIRLALQALTGLVTAAGNFLTSISQMTPLLIGVVAAFASYQVALTISNGVQMAHNALLIATGTRYVLLNGALVAVRTATIGQTVAQTALNLVMAANPIALVIAALGGLAGALIASQTQTDNSKSSTERLSAARTALKDANNKAKESEQTLKDAMLNQQGASLVAERAQKNYNDAVRMYGKNSLEAREALHQRNVAESNLKKANEDSKKAQEENRKATEEQTRKNKEAAAAEKQRKTEMEFSNKVLEVQRKKLQDVGLELNSLNGKTFNYTLKGTQIGPTPKSIGARASGGTVRAGQPYFVGENRDGSLNRTSELFVPGQSGTIVSSRRLQDALRAARGITPETQSGGPGIGTFRNGGSSSAGIHIENLNLPNVREPEDFARELKLAVVGR